MPISGVKPYLNLFFLKTNLRTVAVSNFQVPTRCKVSKTENICSWKKIVMVLWKKKNKIFPLTWLQSQCILVIALLVLFGLSALFSNTKKLSAILNFRKQYLSGHVQRSTLTMWSKWWPKSCKAILESWEGVWLACGLD